MAAGYAEMYRGGVLVQFLPEQIELLWLIPVIALVVFIFIIQFIAQKKEQSPLSEEVARFNTGSLSPVSESPKEGIDRLGQLEQAISSITDSLSAQQQALTQVSKGNSTYSSEINDLKAKLRELYKEYDIVLSENYSLKAKVKKLEEWKQPPTGKHAGLSERAGTAVSGHLNGMDNDLPSKVDMKLYEDTRTLNIAMLDDTSEIDINDLTKRNNP